MARRSDHTREELEKLIIDSAEELLAKKGRDALTARHVAAKAGYVPGTIYNLFGSMDGVIIHLNARTLESLHAILASACKGDKADVRATLRRMAAAYLHFVDKNKNAWLLMFDSKLPESRARLEWYQEKIDSLFALLESAIAPVFPAGKAREKQIAARVLWSSFHGLCYLQEKGQLLTVSKNISLLETTDFMIEHLITGVLHHHKP